MAQVSGPIHLRMFISTVIKNLKYYNPHMQAKISCSNLLFRPIISIDVKIKVSRLISNCSFDFLLWNKQTKKHVNDSFHSSFKRATKKDFAILPQETDILWKYPRKPNVNKRQENQRQNTVCLTDWLNLEGDTYSTCFRSPLCLPLGTELSVSYPQPAHSFCFPLPGASPCLTFDSFLPMI